MKSWLPLSLVFAVGAFQAHADCIYPKAPAAAPDGNTATMEQMIAGKKDVAGYNADMTQYLDCIKKQEEALAPADPSKLSSDEKKIIDGKVKILDQKYNAAVDELQSVAGRFNEQIKIYKAKQKK